MGITVRTTDPTGWLAGGASNAVGAYRGPDAVALLMSAHRAVEKLFAQFDRARDLGRKKDIADQICSEIRAHVQIEHEIVLPASRPVLQNDRLIETSVQENAATLALIGEIEAMQPGQDLFDAKVTILGEQVERHVDVLEETYFPKGRKSHLDLMAMAARIWARRGELTGRP